MRKCDIHTHILPANWPSFKEKFGYGGFIKLEHISQTQARMVRDDGKFFREIESNCYDIEDRILDMDKRGVDLQVISTVPIMFNYWAKPEDTSYVCQFLNDHIAQVISKYPRRLIGLASLPMQAPELAIKELERCINELGLAGIQIGSHINEWNLNDENIFSIFQAASDLGAAVFVHPWDMMGQEKMQKYFLPWLVGMPAETSLAICSMIFGGVFEKLPKLRVAFAHGGGSFPGTIGRIEHGFLARPDLCAIDNNVNPKNYLGKFWVDSLVHDIDALQNILKIFGENKIALGSDFPFPLGEEFPGTLIESLPVTDNLKEKLLYSNALTWLGDKASKIFSN